MHGHIRHAPHLKMRLLLLVPRAVPCSRASAHAAQAGQLLVRLLLRMMLEVSVRIMLLRRGVPIAGGIMHGGAGLMRWLGHQRRIRRVLHCCIARWLVTFVRWGVGGVVRPCCRPGVSDTGDACKQTTP